jgi:hypothetical protein
MIHPTRLPRPTTPPAEQPPPDPAVVENFEARREEIARQIEEATRNLNDNGRPS